MTYSTYFGAPTRTVSAPADGTFARGPIATSDSPSYWEGSDST